MKDVYVNIKGYSFEKKFSKDLVSLDDILNVLEDLFFDCESLEEKIEDMENDINDNFQRVSISSQVEFYDREII